MSHKVSVILLSARLLCCWFVSMSSRRGTVHCVLWSIFSFICFLLPGVFLYLSLSARLTQLWVPLSFQVHTQDDPSPSLLVKLIPFLVSANYLSLYATTGSILSSNYYIGSILSTNFLKKNFEYCFLPWGCELSKGKHSAGNSQTMFRTWCWLPGLHPKHKDYQAFWWPLAEAKSGFQTSSSHQFSVEWTLTNMS